MCRRVERLLDKAYKEPFGSLGHSKDVCLVTVSDQKKTDYKCRLGHHKTFMLILQNLRLSPI